MHKFGGGEAAMNQTLQESLCNSYSRNIKEAINGLLILLEPNWRNDKTKYASPAHLKTEI